jgi:hypothetical protein
MAELDNTLAAATLPLPPILSLRFSDRLPLHVRDAIGSTAIQRPDVIFDVAGTGTARPPGRGARMLTLKFVLDGIRAMSPGQNQARQDYQRDSKNHRSGEAQRHDRENALMSVTAIRDPTGSALAGFSGIRAQIGTSNLELCSRHT